MGTLGNASEVKSNLPSVQQVRGVWTGAGAADLSHTSTDWSKGISSVDQTATGKYTIYLTEWGQQLVGSYINIRHTTAATKQRAGVTKAGFNSSAGTVTFEVFTDDAVSGVPTLADVVSGDKVEIVLEFVRSAP
jgi:hypothetical protein